MAADFTIVQGDTTPVFADTLTYDDGTPVDLTDATLAFTMRTLIADSPLTLTGTTSAPAPALGDIQFAPSAADTQLPGQYMGNWRVTFPDSSTMTFPTLGYLTVEIIPSLVKATGGQLVSLPDIKDYLSIPATDRAHDQKLIRFIEACRPIVESITGPIIPTVYEEWHDGGGGFIQIRRRPSTGYGTTPVLDLIGVSEYRGSAEYPLSIVANPGIGQTYSCMIDRLGTITRRSSGGGTTPFYPGVNSVHVWYRAGQSSVPWNVYEGTLELLRVNYQTTMAAGRASLAETDALDTGRPLGFYVSRVVREMLSPNRRAPAVA